MCTNFKLAKFPGGTVGRINLPMQGTWAQSLARKIPHAVGKPSWCATTAELARCNY